MTDEPQTKSGQTEYAIFARNNKVEEDAWFFLGVCPSTRKEEAIEAVVENYKGARRLDVENDDGDPTGLMFKAVPMSSWKDTYEPFTRTGIRKKK